MKNFLCTLFWLGSFCVVAQVHYTIDQSVPVTVNGKQLGMPWAGGLNSAQVNTLDVNSDGQQDIVIFDKGVGKIWTYLRQQNTYRYAPEFEHLFPTEISSFILLRDYNCDGKKDLFTFNSNINGISVYQNTTPAGAALSWKKLMFFTGTSKTEILLTKGFSSLINILPGFDDVPNISDVDGDGDLDIVNMRFVNPSTAEYHKNLSKERYGTCDSLVFERQTQRWGDWEECSCGLFAFAKSCADIGGRTEHTGGKGLLVMDTDGDGKKDILFSEEQCQRIYLMHNNGTNDSPVVSTSTVFPAINPTAITTFAVPFLEDVDADGIPDLIASPNLNARVYFNTDFSQSLWFYKNTGTVQSPNFTFVKNNFLQEDMIDIGDNSVPAFIDYDGDGDQDMFIGTFTSSTQDFTGRIYQYQNTGTPTSPAFSLVTNDFGGLSLLKLYNLRPHFADANSDGKTDLIFTATQMSNGVTSLYYVPNTSTTGLTLDFNAFTMLNFKPASTENVLLADVNSDGVTDLLIGKSTGALYYYENTGNAGEFNFTLKNTAFLNLGASTSRQNLSLSIADVDADGYQDLVIGDQLGVVTVYTNFKSTNPVPMGENDLFYNKDTEAYESRNLSGRVWPVVVNLFNTDKPSIVVGNATGGVYLLKSDESNELPPDPVVKIYPNPVKSGEELSIKADRNISLQLYSILGQKMSEPVFIPAHQTYALPVQAASGIYIARVMVNGKSYGFKFVVL